MNTIINIRNNNNYNTVLQLIVYWVRIGTTQLCSEALIYIERSKRSKYSQAQSINYAMLRNAYLFHRSCTKSPHIAKVKSYIRQIDNRSCHRRESELTVQSRNTCYQLQKIVYVCSLDSLCFCFFFSFFLSLSVLFSYSFYDNLLHSRDIFSIHRLSRQDRKTNRHETPTWKPAWKLGMPQINLYFVVYRVTVLNRCHFSITIL